uniref:START domain-containing protein n=1 Tax=Schistocephalus solidus TaxID=70667 RepID=A0A183TTJ8_SCHSO
LRIRYSTFPIRPNQKAVIRCQPEQEIFNRFLRVKYWEVYRNSSLIATVAHSADRYSVINATKYPELHIRNVNEAELNELGVRCVLQSIVDESQEIRPTETGRLQQLFMSFSYEEVHSVSTEVNVLAVSSC